MAINATLPAIPYTGTRSDVFAQRVRQILGTLAVMQPALMVSCDLYRLAVVNNLGYSDENTQVLVRLAEGIQGFNLEHEDRLFQQDVGLIRTRVNWLILPAGFGLEPDDQVVINNVPYMITEAKEEMGVCRCTLSQPKNRWVKPAHGATAFRQIGIGCYIA
jgi:hypothetical protein